MRILLLLLLLPATLFSQSQPAWEKFVFTGAIRAFDVTPDGRYAVLLEDVSSNSSVLAVWDRERQELKKYRHNAQVQWQRIDVIDEHIVRVSSITELAEFDLISRAWIRHVINTDVTSRCSTSTRTATSFNVYTNTFLLTELDCVPPRARLYAAEDLRLLKTVDVPAPFTHAISGRTQDEILFYASEVGLGVDATSIIAPPPNTFITNIYTVNNEVYVFCKRTSFDSVLLCRIDLDKGQIAHTRIFDDNIGYSEVHATPDLGQVHVLTNRQSPVVDAITLETIYVSPVRTHDRMRKVDNTYVFSEIGRHLHSTTDPSMLGDTLVYRNAATRTATQDHLGRIVFADDTVKIMDPTTGSSRPTDMMRRGIAVPWAGELIGDPTSQVVTIFGLNTVRTGDDLSDVVCTICPLTESETDTFANLMPYVRIDRSLETIAMWVRKDVHGFPVGAAPRTCTWDRSVSDGRTYWFWTPTMDSLRIDVMWASTGRVGFLVSDTVMSSSPLVAVGDVYIWNNSQTDALEIRDATGDLIDTFSVYPRIVPLSASDANKTVMSWRSADSTLCLLDLTSRTIVWSTQLWSKPTSIVMDRSGGWCFVVQRDYGLQQLYTLTMSSVESDDSYSVRIAPNPAADSFTVIGDDLLKWELYDNLGMLLDQGTAVTINAPDLAGMYFVRVLTGGVWIVKSVVVVR